ncbi:MAG: cytochrome o ubiquinol oxidase subunit IV, partial [Steroidobacter sp.]|nr:cytochrome o ubiquinol oxidase subunit IV [Steroidobacter sp.]
MSAHDHASEHDPGLVHGTEPHGTLREYVIGFLLSVVLTAVP